MKQYNSTTFESGRWVFKPVPGYAVEHGILALQDVRLFVSRNWWGTWTVSETSTGARLGTGRTRREAIVAVKARMATEGPERVRERLARCVRIIQGAAE